MPRKSLRVLFFAASVTVGVARPASATLILDLRASYVTGPATIVDPHLVHVTGTGAVINMDLVAQIVGKNTDLTDDGFLSAPFVFESWDDVSPTPSLRGPMIAHRDSLMMGPGSSDGMQIDLDDDGDLDVGGPFNLVSNDAPNPILGDWFLLAHASFTVESYIGQGSNDLIANVADFRSFKWLEDGQMFDRTNGQVWGTPYVVASAVAVPEPVSLLLTSVATFASALRPRRRDQ